MNLKKEIETSKTRYCVQYDDHSRMMCSVLCSLMEHQSLVDLAIRCGNSTIHAHKCVLAANSPYFRVIVVSIRLEHLIRCDFQEQLEKNPTIEQIVINGLDFTVVKSIVEFMYCGETNVIEENFKYMVAASKLFQIRGIQALAADDHYDAGSVLIFILVCYKTVQIRNNCILLMSYYINVCVWFFNNR